VIVRGRPLDSEARGHWFRRARDYAAIIAQISLDAWAWPLCGLAHSNIGLELAGSV
jgi:hypothetical protein